MQLYLLSLYDVLGGHFISRTGAAARDPPKPDPEPRVIDCKECGKMFTSTLNLERHKLTHAEGRDKFVCNKCERSFLSEVGLAKHMTKHIDPVQCGTCDKKFTTQEYLDQHMLLHKEKEDRFGKTY